MKKEGSEQDRLANDALTPSAREALERATAEIANRLSTRGVRITGSETSDQLVSLLESVERFERAVQSAGGDLMVDEGPRGVTREPDQARFVIPRRRDDESVVRYINRVDEAAVALQGDHDIVQDDETT